MKSILKQLHHRLEKVGLARSYEKEHMQNIMVFKTESGGPFKRLESEASELVFLGKEEVAKSIESDPEQFTPAFREALNLVYSPSKKSSSPLL